MLQVVDHELAGRVAYIEPNKQWGYLHGESGERVYFHSTVVAGEIDELVAGDTVCYRLSGEGARPSVAWVGR